MPFLIQKVHFLHPKIKSIYRFAMYTADMKKLIPLSDRAYPSYSYTKLTETENSNPFTRSMAKFKIAKNPQMPNIELRQMVNKVQNFSKTGKTVHFGQFNPIMTKNIVLLQIPVSHNISSY